MRLQLGRITRSLRDVTTHLDAIAGLAGHSIRQVPPSDPRVPSSASYNCFAFAFNLADAASYQAVISRFKTIGADSRFVEHLIRHSAISEVESLEVHTGDTVLYLAQSEPKHAGKVFGDRVVSKWGCGLLWDHPVDEVPDEYGTVLRYFRQLSPAHSDDAFRSYVYDRFGIKPRDFAQWLGA